MRRIEMLATALSAVLLTAPAFAHRGDAVQEMSREQAGTTLGRADGVILAQGGGGSESGTGGVSSATPGSPSAGNLGSTPQEMQGRSQQPAQGAATTLAPTQGRGAADPSATPGRMQTAPGGTGTAPGDQPRR